MVNTIRCRECGGYVELIHDGWPTRLVTTSAVCNRCRRTGLLRIFGGASRGVLQLIARRYPELHLLPRGGKVREKQQRRVGMRNRRRDKQQNKPMGRR